VPTLNKRQPEPEADQSKWFIVTAGPNHPFTFQLEPEGYKWLLAAGLSNESDIDWDVFGTLRSLDLLYTLNSSYTPSDAPVPDDLSFEEISDKERIRLAEGLLDKFSAAELSSKEGHSDSSFRSEILLGSSSNRSWRLSSLQRHLILNSFRLY